jgi:hypothetical protein
MQAAGRMRQLSEGQSINLVGIPKVFNEIRRVNNLRHSLCFKQTNIGIKQVLSWVIQNTVESISTGLGVWGDQGLFYATAKDPHHFVFAEKLDLSAFYGKPIYAFSIPEIAASAKLSHCHRTGGGNKTLMEEIIHRCNTLGAPYTVMGTGADEECEREMEREIEQEEEQEVEFHKMTVNAEVDWDYEAIFSSSSITDLPIKTYEIATIIEKMSCKSLAGIKWSKNIHCTENFIHTVVETVDGPIDEYLRIPDGFVVFPCGSVLLLSDREVNAVLPIFHREIAAGTLRNGLYFSHFAFETNLDPRKYLRCGNKRLALKVPTKYLCCSNEDLAVIPDDVACSLKLFNGETQYPGSQRNVLKKMLSSAWDCDDSSKFNLTKASGEPEYLVAARRKNMDLDRSDLEKICEELACEFEAQVV